MKTRLQNKAFTKIEDIPLKSKMDDGNPNTPRINFWPYVRLSDPPKEVHENTIGIKIILRITYTAKIKMAYKIVFFIGLII